MRIKMLKSKVVEMAGGGTIAFRIGEFYLAEPGSALEPETAKDWIMEGMALDEAGEIVRPEPKPEPEPEPDLETEQSEELEAEPVDSQAPEEVVPEEATSEDTGGDG